MDLCKQAFFKGDYKTKYCFGFLKYGVILLTSSYIHKFSCCFSLSFVACGSRTNIRVVGKNTVLKNYTHKNTANGCRKTQPSLCNWKGFLAAAVTVLLNIQDILYLKVVDDAFLVIYPPVINVATGSGKGFIYHSGNRTSVCASEITISSN